jgi:hypothetical protein
MPVEIPAGESATCQLSIGESGELLVEHGLGVGFPIVGDARRNARAGSLGRLPDPDRERGRRRRGR